MPASTLSRRIASLEKELGVSLVNRSTRTFALTEAGQTLYERGRKLLAEANRVTEGLREDASAVLGHIRIGIMLELAQTLFFPVLADFVRDNAGITFEVISIQGHADLISERLDIAFLVAHQMTLPDSSYVTHRVGSFSRLLFASKAYLKRSAPLREPVDLEQHSCLRLARETVQKEWELRRGQERQRVKVSGSFSAGNVGLLAQFAREHQGITILANFLASHPMFGTGLVRVLPEWKAVPAHIFALTVSKVLPAKIAKLMDVVKASMGRELERLA